MGGRNRKPIPQHKIEGTYEPGVHGGYGVDADGRPIMPKGLNNTQRWFWKKIVNNLPPEVFGEIDDVALRMACDLWDKWMRSKDEDNPQKYYQALAAAKGLNQILSKFGWTPADRAKLRTPSKKSDNDDFFGMVG